LLANVRAVGSVLADGIRGVSHRLIAGQRGTGLWQAIVLAEPVAATVEAAARQAGFLVNAVQPDAIRIAPPLILRAEQASSFVAALPGIMARADELLGQPA
jgi:acetylornithine/N-succinyldiaminopimelate aminotransferase